MIDVNVGAALWLTQAVVPYLRDRDSGSIVQAARIGSSTSAAGCTTQLPDPSAISRAALVARITMIR